MIYCVVLNEFIDTLLESNDIISSRTVLLSSYIDGKWQLISQSSSIKRTILGIEPEYVTRLRISTCAELDAAQQNILVPNNIYACFRITSKGIKNAMPCACCGAHICQGLQFLNVETAEICRIDDQYRGQLSYAVVRNAVQNNESDLKFINYNITQERRASLLREIKRKTQ